MSPAILKELDTFKQAWKQILGATTAVAALCAAVAASFGGQAEALPPPVPTEEIVEAAVKATIASIDGAQQLREKRLSEWELQERVDALEGYRNNDTTGKISRENRAEIEEMSETLDGIWVHVLWIVQTLIPYAREKGLALPLEMPVRP